MAASADYPHTFSEFIERFDSEQRAHRGPDRTNQPASLTGDAGLSRAPRPRLAGALRRRCRR